MKKILVLFFVLIGGLALANPPGTYQPLLLNTEIKAIFYQNSSATQTTNTIYTFSSQPIGEASPNRRVIVGITGTNAGGSIRTISSVTIGGISASAVGSTSTADGSTTAIYIANVPTGTTASIVVTWSGSQDGCGIGVWSATGLTSNTPLSTATSISEPVSLNLSTTAINGFTIAIKATTANNTNTVNWSNATKDFQRVYYAATRLQSGAHGSTTGSSITITATQSGVSTNFNTSVAAAF